MFTKLEAYQVSWWPNFGRSVDRCGRFVEILAFLLKNKLIDGDNMTVTGLSLGENLERWTHEFGELDFRQDVIRPLDKPIKSTGHIR
jgi:dihydroxy-acid dehydratase